MIEKKYKIKDLSEEKRPREKHMSGAGHRKRLRNSFLQSGLDLTLVLW